METLAWGAAAACRFPYTSPTSSAHSSPANQSARDRERERKSSTDTKADRKGALSLHSFRFHSSTSTSTPTPPQPPAQKQKPKKLSKILPAALTPHENIYNLPNILTFSRLLASPVIGYLVLHDQPAAALGLFAAAGLTDLVDGWIARRWKLQTVVGSVIDPMADKVLMTILTVTLAMQGLLPGTILSLYLPSPLLFR